MYSIELQTIFYECQNKNRKINTSFVSLDPRPLGANKAGIILIVFFINIRGKLSIIRCDKYIYYILPYILYYILFFYFRIAEYYNKLLCSFQGCYLLVPSFLVGGLFGYRFENPSFLPEKLKYIVIFL